MRRDDDNNGGKSSRVSPNAPVTAPKGSEKRSKSNLSGSTEHSGSDRRQRLSRQNSLSQLVSQGTRKSHQAVSAAFRRKLEWFSSPVSHAFVFMTDEQIVRQRWLILPNSARKITWDWVVIGIVAWNLFEIPLILGFRIERPTAMIVLNALIDVLLVVDVGLSFRTCHYALDRALVLDVAENRRLYLTSWFVPDALTTIPYDWVFFAVQPTLGGWLDLAAKFVRLTRIFRLVKLANHLASARLIRIMMLTVGLCFWSHWIACGWWALGLVQPDPLAFPAVNGTLDVSAISTVKRIGGVAMHIEYGYGEGGVSWVYRLGLQYQPVYVQYFAAFYHALTCARPFRVLAPCARARSLAISRALSPPPRCFRRAARRARHVYRRVCRRMRRPLWAAWRPSRRGRSPLHRTSSSWRAAWCSRAPYCTRPLSARSLR